ncbi:MAG: hypothetical protein GTN36_03255 [Candidatus Aenigmarchaeota archaeon]|nr:hypothetical protein [Candidatus Aenigmarchaeota archaeon]
MVILKNLFIKTETERATYLGSEETRYLVDLNQNRDIDAGPPQIGLGFPITLTRHVFRTKKGEELFTRSEIPADDLKVGEECNLERKYLCLGIGRIEVDKQVSKI